jgi:hypothetical protein
VIEEIAQGEGDIAGVPVIGTVVEVENPRDAAALVGPAEVVELEVAVDQAAARAVTRQARERRTTAIREMVKLASFVKTQTRLGFSVRGASGCQRHLL